jgi:biofilm PGA synthesis lipoprotein PgaB
MNKTNRMYFAAALALLITAGSFFLSAADSFIVLSYHDVRDKVYDHYDPDMTAVSTQNLIAHLAWLKGHGYHPVSIGDLLDARAGKRPLPGKAVLLTFDDGLKSLYTRVYPVLRMFGYPAAAAVTGSWLEGDPAMAIKYGDRTLTAEDFITPAQMREMAGSGLVEFVSHGYDLHRGVPGNPFGNKLPAGTTRIYDKNAGRYEDDAAYENRIRADLEKSAALMEKYLGQRPRAIAWPYGKYNQTTIEIAASLGMTINLTVETRANTLENLELASRTLIIHNPGPEDFAWEMAHGHEFTDPVRVVQLDLDYLYDADPVQRGKNLDRLLERIKRMDINVVFLQAFADEDGDGAANALYFPNRHLPVKADLFNRVAWQLKTRCKVKVFAWMPVLAFTVPGFAPGDYVSQARQKGAVGESYQRLSPFHPRARSVILDIYEDLAKHADFEGILFHDDAVLNDFEDAGPGALEFYRREWGLPAGIDAIRRDPELFQRWSVKKTQYLIEFTQQLCKRVEKYRAPLETARGLHARLILEPASSAWFAQSYPLFLENYSFTAVMAMPYLENAKKPKQWLTRLVHRAKQSDPGLKKTIFELQTRDWRGSRNIPTAVLVKQMEGLQLNGGLSFGYYPDDFIQNHPVLKEIRKGISLRDYPYRER